jgi:hypothetical protein
MIQVQVLVIPEPIFARQARARVRAHFTNSLVVCDSCCSHLIARALVGGSAGTATTIKATMV